MYDARAAATLRWGVSNRSLHVSGLVGVLRCLGAAAAVPRIALLIEVKPTVDHTL